MREFEIRSSGGISTPSGSHKQGTEKKSLVKQIVNNTVQGIRSAILAVTNFSAKSYEAVFKEKKINYMPSNPVKKNKKYKKADLLVASSADEGLLWKKELISSATTSIELSPNFAGGKDFREILGLIETRMTTCPELKVHLLLSPDLLEKEDKNLLISLGKKFGERFNCLISKRTLHAFPLRTEENHIKILVVDSKYFVVGGSTLNEQLAHESPKKEKKREGRPWSSSVLPQSSRDCDIVGMSHEGAAAIRKRFFKVFQLCEQKMNGQAKARFFETPEGSRGNCKRFDKMPGVVKKAKIKVLLSRPNQKINPITAEYAKRIKKIKEALYLGTLYFHPAKEIASALKLVKQKKTCLISNGTPPQCSLAAKIGAIFSRQKYHLVNKVYEYQGPKGEAPLYHRKVGVFDETHSIIGSYNLAYKSAKLDYEIAIVTKNKRIAKKFKEILLKDIAESEPANLAKYQKKGVYKTFTAVIRFFKNFL